MFHFRLPRAANLSSPRWYLGLTCWKNQLQRDCGVGYEIVPARSTPRLEHQHFSAVEATGNLAAVM
jgi:hypothetical protein